MKHSIFLPRKPNMYRIVDMFLWLKDNVPKNMFTWDYADRGSIVLFKDEADLLAFKIRWNV